MNSSWILNDNAADRVKALLEQAGLPLELNVASICNDFCNKYDKQGETYYRTERLVYSSSKNKDDYRELDQKSTIYGEFVLGELRFVSLQMQMSIECKYRKDIEVFAFPLVGNTSYKRFPVHSSMKGSQLFASLANTFEQFSNVNICSPIFLEIKGGETPQKVHDENLVYNASSTLYDFVLNDLENQGNENWADEMVKMSGLVDEFQQYIRQTHFYWPDVIDKWLLTIDKKRFDTFNKQYVEHFRNYGHMVSAHMPIVCMNAPIYKVNWTTQEGIKSFQEIPYFITSIRKHGWPGLTSRQIFSRNPEVPVIITNPSNLLSVLELGKKWYAELHSQLTNAPEVLIHRWILESNLYSLMIRDFQKIDEEIGYRSDYDLGL